MEDLLEKQRVEEHLSTLFASIDPEKIGADYQNALAQDDRQTMAHTLAAYFRQRPACPVKRFCGKSEYDRETAEKAARGTVTVVNIEHTFPDGRIDFNFNPTRTQKPLNNEWLWQLNRHAFWYHMAGLYQENGDESIAAAFDRQLRDWVLTAICPEQHQGPDSTWRTIECGLRLLGNWQVAFEAFRHSPGFTDENLLLMVESMHRQAVFLSGHYTAKNFLIMETTGVFTFTALFREFTDEAALRTGAIEPLTRELESQFLPDGFHNELSPDYFLVVFSCYASVLEIARSCGLEQEIPEKIYEILHQAAHTAVKLSTPGFQMPRTNDCYTIHTREITELGAAFFQEDPVLAFVNSQRKQGQPPQGETASCFLPYAGFAVMRQDWGEDAAYLCMDVGPTGTNHCHMDMLNINLFKGSQELLYDDGGGQYEKSLMRKYGRSSFDHNVVTVDGLGQQRSTPTVSEAPIDCGWISTSQYDYACALYQDGFGPEEKRLAFHQRQVRFAKPGFFVVADTLTSRDGKMHQYEARFHLDTLCMEPVRSIPGALRACMGKTYDLLLVPLDRAKTNLCQGQKGKDCAQCAGWYLGRNDQKNHPATTVTRTVRHRRKHRFVTLLFPVKTDTALPVIRRWGEQVKVVFEGKEYSFSLRYLNR